MGNREARRLLLGCVADDVTGATDLASVLALAGLDVVQVQGLPHAEDAAIDTDALVVALKTRTVPAEEAVSQSVAAARFLLSRQVRHLYFKYCSTFDSTHDGNIGPVAEALLDLVGGDLTVVCPAYPQNRRTVYQGHLFVGDRLLSESGMRHHPLTPMTDADLVRVLSRQCRGAAAVGLAPSDVIEAGSEAVRSHLAELRSRGVRFAVTDVTAARHLGIIADAARTLRLWTGGAALAGELPRLYRQDGLLAERQGIDPLPAAAGPTVVLAGSCSEATRAQVATMAARHPVLVLDPVAVAEGRQQPEALAAAALQEAGAGAVLVHSSLPPEQVAEVQRRLGRAEAGALVEDAFARIARAVVEAGVRRLIVAGGETAGSVVKALGVRRLRIGAAIAPGVPWTCSVDPPHLRLALKSGNFGGDDFFLRALEVDQ